MVEVLLFCTLLYLRSRQGYSHTERQAAASSEAADLKNGFGTHSKRHGEHHIQVNGDLLLTLLLPLDVRLDARCGYSLTVPHWSLTIYPMGKHSLISLKVVLVVQLQLRLL